MASQRKMLDPVRIHRMKQQGYLNYTDEQLSDLAFGNRFAYRLCSLILLAAVVTANLYLLGFMLVVATLGFVLPNHPFDYIYNYFLSERMGMPRLPRRSNQLKFACFIASLWIAATLMFFYSGPVQAGYIMGAMLFTMASVVGTTDICLPSILYNQIFGIKIG